MAGGSNAKFAKGTGEKKKRKRPSKKVPTTVVEASSYNFMNTVQKLTGSADELSYHAGGSSASAPPRSASPSPLPSPYSSPSHHTSHHDQDYSQSSYHHHQAAHYPHSTMDDDLCSDHNYSAYNPALANSTGGSYSHQYYNPSSQPMDHHQYSGSYGYPGNYGSDHVGGNAAAGYDVGGGSGSTRVCNDDVEYQQPDRDDLYEGLYSSRSYYNSVHETMSDAHHIDDLYYNPTTSSSRANHMAEDGNSSPYSWRDPINYHNSTSDYWPFHVDPMHAS